MRPGIKRAARWLALAALLVLLALFARTVDWRTTWSAIAGASLPLLLAATIANLGSLAAKGVMWWIFLRPLGARSMELAMRATLVGAALSNLLPANAGEGARTLLVAREGRVPAAAVLGTLAAERLLELVPFVLFIAFVAPFLSLPRDIERWTRPALLALAALAIAVVGGMMLVRRLRRGRVPGGVDVAALTGWRRFRARLADGLATASSARRVLAATALSCASWLLQAVTYHLTARALALPITFAGTLAALVIVNASFFARVTPGSVGLVQLLYAGTAVALGLSRDRAVAVSLVLQALQIIPVTLMGVALAPRSLLARSAELSARGD